MNYEGLISQAKNVGLADILAKLLSRSRMTAPERSHGELRAWQDLLDNLPDVSPSSLDFNSDVVTIGQASDISSEDQAAFKRSLLQLSPWRKGPFNIFGINIDSEWRSELKWRRLEKCLGDDSFRGKSVLDVGSGNGYYLCRLLGAGAEIALGLDPTQRFVMQFEMLRTYFPDKAVGILPLSDEALQGCKASFDLVLSMGVIYHRRNPMDHLKLLRQVLSDSGTLILETLVIEGGVNSVLVPEQRYAKMRNVWAIPSCLMAEQWLETAGFKNIQLIDVSVTTVEEQRRTLWMQFESLSDFLDPLDKMLTVEGYPAPTRALFSAQL